MERQTESPPPEAFILQMLGGQMVSRCIGVAADLGVADHLAAGPRSVDELAGAVDAHPDALYRTLRLLAGFGIFAELPGRRFQNTPASDVLRSDAPASMRHMARWLNDPLRWRALGDLDWAVRTGRPALLKDGDGDSPFDVLQRSPASAATFNQAMTSVSSGEGRTLVETYDFRPYRRIVDVGGGHGLLATLIAGQAPDARVTVFDMPQVVAGAADVIRAAGLEGRVTTAAGSYHDGVPGPADLVVMKNIVHGEDDAGAVRLLTHARAALADGGRVLVVEHVVTEGPAGHGARAMDVEMLFVGGRQRTEAEHAALLDAAGLRLERVIPVGATAAVEAVPAA